MHDHTKTDPDKIKRVGWSRGFKTHGIMRLEIQTFIYTHGPKDLGATNLGLRRLAKIMRQMDRTNAKRYTQNISGP